MVTNCFTFFKPAMRWQVLLLLIMDSCISGMSNDFLKMCKSEV